MSLGELRPQTGLINLYHLSDVNDASGNSRTLTNNNTVTFTTGKFGNGANFGNANSNKSLYIAGNQGITSTTGTLTLGGWFKLNAEISTGIWTLATQVMGIAGAQAQIFLDYNYNGGTRRLDFARSGSTAEGPVYTITLGTSKFYFIVLTYDGTNIKGYVDGKLVTSGNVGSGTNTNSDLFFSIAANKTYGNFGSIMADECFLFNVAKSASWVRKQYSLGRFGEL